MSQAAHAAPKQHSLALRECRVGVSVPLPMPW